MFVPRLEVKFERIHEDAKIPTYATIGDSGMDVYALEDVFIPPSKTVLVSTGLKIDIPVHPFHGHGYRWEMQVRPRSGISLKTYLRVANSPGTVDNYYRDEIKIIMHNSFPVIYDHEDTVVHFANRLDGAVEDVAEYSLPPHTYLIKKGDRIAQFVFNEIVRPTSIIEGKISDELSRKSSFGETGIQ